MRSSGIEQAVKDADTFFRVELPALREWEPAREQVARIQQPVLLMRGNETGLVFREVQDLLQQWLPQATGVVVPRAGHAVQLINPRAVAEALATFFAQQP